MKILLFSEASTVNINLLKGQCGRVLFAKRPANAPAKLQNKNTSTQSTLGDTGSLIVINIFAEFIDKRFILASSLAARSEYNDYETIFL